MSSCVAVHTHAYQTSSALRWTQRRIRVSKGRRTSVMPIVPRQNEARSAPTWLRVGHFWDTPKVALRDIA
jgi:hypothetical protein